MDLEDVMLSGIKKNTERQILHGIPLICVMYNS